MEFFNNHKNLYWSALSLFVGLSLMVAIMPAINNQRNNAPLPNSVALSQDAIKGKQAYIANGCVACHTQQVRNVDMDKIWGSRPGIPADYARIKRTDVWRNTATLMGSERTGPDLTNVGNRQPSLAWNLLHLYQPRAVVDGSVMPAYPWLFEIKKELGKNDVEVKLPEKYSKGVHGKIVATKEALQLVAYLQSLKQVDLPTGVKPAEFLYKQEEKPLAKQGANDLPDGKALYTQNCSSCHQANGEGMPGAFPSLKGSPIVNGDDLDLYVNIIMLGYDARPEYATMNAVGLDNNLSAADIAAIINYERSSWGNKGKKVTADDVKKIQDVILLTAKK